MKKIYLQSITGFITFAKDGIRSFKLFLIALTLSCFCSSTQAQVVITPANDTLVCSRTAVTGTAPVCTNLGSMIITETLNGDFALGADQIILNTPANWQFCVGAPVVMTASGGGDISGPITFSYTGSTSLTINFSTSGGALPDQITITGLQVQPTLTTAAPGNIFCSGLTGVIGIAPGVIGTSFGRLACIPLPITGTTSICVGDCKIWTSSPGVTWTTANAGIASVNSSGTVCGVSAGSTTITATLSGCIVTQNVSVIAGPAPITGAHTMCAWFDTMTVRDATLGGLFSAWGLTVANVGPGTGFVHSQAPGVDTIFYTSPSGCVAKVIVTVNPLPGPFGVAPFQVCVGSSRVFHCPPGPNSFTVVPITGAASVTSLGGDSVNFTGSGVGTVKVVATSTITGCKTDTTFTINPIPAPVTGTLEICELQSTTLIDSPAGGTWTISGGAATIASTSIIGTRTFCTIAGNAPAPYTTVVTYTLPTGCATIATLTVDALPAPISGLHALCVGDSITLTDASPGGTWVSTNTSVAVIGSSSGVLTGVGTGGIDTIIYTINPGGCTAMFIVTVNPLPSPIFGTDHVCVGSSAPESASPSGGVWSATPSTIGIIDVVGTITGVSPGVVTICYTLGTGCATCKDVTVDPLPAPIVGPDTLCVTNTIHLTDATPGGFWTSLDTTYLTIDSLGNATGMAATSTGVTVLYTVGNCSVSMIVTVNPYPYPIHGPVGVCMSDTIYLTDSLPGGIWVSNNPSVASIDSFSGMVIGLSAGSVIISYFSNHGCGVAYPLDVYTKAPITGPDNVCVGQTITLCDTAAGGGWTHTNPSVDALTTLTGCVDVLGIGPGPAIDTIVYTMGTGCRSTKVITINPISPIFGVSSSVCVGFTDSVWDATPGGTWISSDTTKATISSTGFITTLDTGVVVITYLMPTGCQATFVLFINPNPGPINVGPGRLCAGDSLLLSNVDTPGVWIAVPPAVATIGASTGLLHGVSGGVAIVSYFLSTGCYAVAQVTVDPIGPITGPNQVCVNDSIILVDTFGASLGTFTSSNNSIATVHATTGKVHGISAGVDTIYYTLPTGCSAYYVITVNPLPGFIAGPDSVCQLDSITLTNVVPGGVWTSSNGAVATIGSTSGVLYGNTPGVVTITYMLATGCYMTKLVTVNLTPGPIAGITHVCLGRQITLTDPTPGGIWTSSNPGIPITSGGVVSGDSLDTTIITYTLPIGGCTAKTIVTVNPIPTISIIEAPLAIKCKYATQTLTATGAGAGGIYRWSPATGLTSTVGALVICSATVTTTYTVTGTTIWGCDTSTTITVVVDDSLDHLMIVGKDNICEGECDTLMASGRAHTFFNWHPASGLSCTICDTVSACPTRTTQYWAVAIDDIGCKDSVSFTVNVRPLPLLHVNPSPTIVCRGRPLQLKVGSNTTDSTTDVYSWAPNLFISCDTCDNPILIDTANIVYRVIGTSEYGCFDSLNIKVSVLDTNRNTISNDTDICYGTSAMLVATSHSVFSNLDIPTFKWFPVWGLSSPDSAATFANPSSTVTYSVAIHENACWDDTLSVTVRVQPYPSVFVTANATTNIVAGTPVQLTASATNTPIQLYLWTPGGTLTCDSCFNPVATPTVNTTYTVTVTSIYGCISTDTISLSLYCDNSQVFIPNTFTPNGDGANDLFYVSGKGIKVITLMQVFNRWGQMVFEAHNIPPNAPGAGWDGTFKGLVLAPDVYVYIVKAQCDLGTTTYSYTGDVSIVK